MAVEQKAAAAGRTERARKPDPVLSVLDWELRRLRANRLSWCFAGGVLLFFMGMIWVRHTWDWRLGDGTYEGKIFISSAFGSLFTITFSLLPLFGMLLPFVASEAVARDYKQRTHEILMTTPVPAAAYILGRYLAILVVSVGLAVLLLIAVMIMSELLYLTQVGYPAPNAQILLTMWAILVLPATVLLSGVSFAVGTLWPRHALTLKIPILTSWIILSYMSTRLKDLLGDWLLYFNPTSQGLANTLLQQFERVFNGDIARVASIEQHRQILFQLQQQLPDLTPWLLPYLTLITISLLSVGLTAATFRRFQNVMN